MQITRTEDCTLHQYDALIKAQFAKEELVIMVRAAPDRSLPLSKLRNEPLAADREILADQPRA